MEFSDFLTANYTLLPWSHLDTIDIIVNWYDCSKSIMIDKKCYELYHIALEQSEKNKKGGKRKGKN